VVHYLLLGKLPATDKNGRPLFAYGNLIHDECPRRAHYEANEFVEKFGDAGAVKGWCLAHVGCKGPNTYNNCPRVLFNDGINWPIGAGHPCIGCTEKYFYDRFTPFYQTLPDVGGFGVESTAETVGWGLVGAVAAGVAVHAGVTAVRHAASRRAAEGSEPLQAFGDSERVWLPNPKRATDATDAAASTPATSSNDESGKAE
jgi:hydrogenase small subunit